MYLPSRELVDIVLPELSDAFMSKYMGLATVRYAQDATDGVTRKIKEGIENETILKKFPIN